MVVVVAGRKDKRPTSVYHTTDHDHVLKSEGQTN